MAPKSLVSGNRTDVQTTAKQLPEFEMKFEALTIDHLGLRLYSSLPPVLSELVSNAYDAEAPKVEITLPSGTISTTSEVIVRDYGHGMSPNELAEEYMPIGRCRRGKGEANVMSKNNFRRVTGRKGLGKLSSFGIATELVVHSIQKGQSVCLRFNYDEIKKWVKDRPGETYKPEVIQTHTGVSAEKDGLIITLRKLHRTKEISADDVRKGLAKRLSFIGAGFVVNVNGTEIGPGDRVVKASCDPKCVWIETELPSKGIVSTSPLRKIKGWIGFVQKSSQTERGIDIFASGKAVELGSYFRLSSTDVQFARAYLIGEIHANFLDDKVDLVATARNSVVWESDAGYSLEDWGQKTLKWAFDKWLEARRQEKAEVIIKASAFDKWLETRTPAEKKVANRLVKILADDVNLDPDSAKPVLEIVKSSVESMAFRDLVDEIDDEGIGVKTLIKLFHEWRVIEAREHLKLADGRLSALKQLNAFMKSGALEVTELQPLFDKHPWLINQKWKEADRQATYSRLIKTHCTEPKGLGEKDRRLDIFAMTNSDLAEIVELKHPRKKLTREDLEQVESYVDWARANLIGSGAHSAKYVNGLLIVGEYNSKLTAKVKRLAGDDIRVETYADLYHKSSEYYGEVERKVAEVAPEYARHRRLKQ